MKHSIRSCDTIPPQISDFTIFFVFILPINALLHFYSPNLLEEVKKGKLTRFILADNKGSYVVEINVLLFENMLKLLRLIITY